MKRRGITLHHTTGHYIEMVDHCSEIDKQHDYYRPHRCVEMEDHEHRHPLRSFVIRYDKDGNWYLFDHNLRGMPIVQCPFCHRQMFTGNQVSIE